MATRVKRILQSFSNSSGSPDCYFTVTENPSTTGDIVTRVLIDNIFWSASNDNSTYVSHFRMFCGGKMIARLYTYGFSMSGSVLITGGTAVVNVPTVYSTQGNYGGGAPYNFQGTGYVGTTSGSFNWHFPPQFYSSVGQQITIEASCTPTSFNVVTVSLICIGEY